MKLLLTIVAQQQLLLAQVQLVLRPLQPQLKELEGETPSFFIMTIKTIGNFTREVDNNLLYYDYLKAYLDSIDPYSSLLINKTDQKINFRLTPSHPELLLPLLTAIKEIHTKFSIQVEFAKSIKSSNSISYIINLL